jgi:hypothetical protein
MNIRYVIPLVATLIAACGGGGDGGGESASQSVPLQDVTLTFFRSFAPGTYVLRSQAELASAWAAAPFVQFPIGIVTSEPAMPTYDFSKYSVVGLSDGVGKWCFAPRITNATSNGKDLVVHYFVPTTGTLACMFNGPLIAFVLVPQVNGTVQFVKDPSPF